MNIERKEEKWLFVSVSGIMLEQTYFLGPNGVKNDAVGCAEPSGRPGHSSSQAHTGKRGYHRNEMQAPVVPPPASF